MDFIESLRIAWQTEFGTELPADFVARLECQKLNSKSTSGDSLNRLSSVFEECKNLIYELRTKLRQEEFFYEKIRLEIESERNRQLCDDGQDVGVVYAQVNKPGNSKQTDSHVQNDQHLSEVEMDLTSTCHYDGEYEDVSSVTDQPNMTNKPLVVKTESLSGQKKINVRGSIKDKIKIFEISESSSSDGEADGDYEQLAPKSAPPTETHVPVSNINNTNTNSEKPDERAMSMFRKRQQHNSYEEIALPFLTNQAGPDKPQSGGPQIGTISTDTQGTVYISHGADQSQTEHSDHQDSGPVRTSRTSSLSRSGKTPPPIPARNYRNKEDYEGRKKEAVPLPTYSDNLPSLSGSLKHTSLGSDSKPCDSVGPDQTVQSQTGVRLSDNSDPGGEYCSLSDVMALKKEPVKHVTLVKVTSSGSEKSDGEGKVVKKQPLGERRSFKVLSVKHSKEISKSTDDLSASKSVNVQSSTQKEAKSTEDLCSSAFYDDVYIPDESDTNTADMKLFGHKTHDNCQDQREESDNLVTGQRSKSLSSSSSEEDLMQTVKIELPVIDDNDKQKDDKENVSSGIYKKRNRKNVPDYEQWNFQTLLTKTGISVAENENLTDTASEDDNIYDNVAEPQGNVSAQSDDSGVSEATTPDELRESRDQLRIDSLNGSPNLRKSNFTSSTSSRVSTTSCMTVDGDSVFLHRSDSIDSKVSVSPNPCAPGDEDTISVCSLEDQLDRPDGYELTGDDKITYGSNQLRMRHLVAKGILESEKSYLNVVNQLVKAKHYLQSVAMKPGSLIAAEDVTTIFYKLDDIYQVHKEFVDNLEKKVMSWSDDQDIGDTFKTLVVYFKVYEEYVKNYQTAVETIHKYQEQEETKHLFEKMFKSSSRGRSNSIASVDKMFKSSSRGRSNSIASVDKMFKSSSRGRSNSIASVDKMFKSSSRGRSNSIASVDKMFKSSSRGRSNSIGSVDEQMDFRDEGSKLEDILLKPVQRIQTNNLVLHDLIKHTPEEHPDYDILKKALKLSEENLKTYNASNVSSSEDPDSRHLVKSGFVVEVSRDKKTNRHLRYVFLFNDIIICTKHKGSSKPKEGAFKFVWCLPMSHLTMHVKGEKKYTMKDSLDDVKYKIGNLKIELREEMLKVDSLKEKAFSIAHKRAMRNVEKLKKKIQEYEATLVEALPRLPLHLESEGFRPHTFLFSTDYEREEWREAMESQLNKYQNEPPVQLTNHECEVLIASTRLHTQVNGIGTVLLKKDEEMLTGSLNVTIHKLQGLDDVCEVYCCLEMDSYGHFYKKAQTRVSKYNTDAAWDQDFELELDGSQTLRILCYKKRPETEDDVIVGKCALELSYSWLNSKFNEKTITMNEVSITVSIRHTPASKTLKRTQSKLKTGIFGVRIENVTRFFYQGCHTPASKTLKRTQSKLKRGIFGVRIENVTRRECKTVPTIVTTCVQQVEARGLEEVGIYRVSGVTSDVQHMKKLFDKNPIAASAEAEVADIHALTGVLKLYFRELPEPLFTERHYPSFIQSIELQNEGAKEKCMLELLHSLPEANYYTIVYMIEHLVRIAKQSRENKMSISNLSTIFGPTLLTPAVKDESLDPMVQMARAAKDAAVQSEVVNFFLKLAASGKNIRKSAVNE